MNIVEIEDEDIYIDELEEDVEELPAVVDASPSEVLSKESDSLISDIVLETSPDKIRDLTDLFNVNQNKRNLLRVAKISELMDKISDHMLERFDSSPLSFTNKELIDYFNAGKTVVSGAGETINSLNTSAPAIVKNTQINVSIGDGLSRESKNRVMDAVRAIMEQTQKQEVNLQSEEDVV